MRRSGPRRPPDAAMAAPGPQTGVLRRQTCSYCKMLLIPPYGPTVLAAFVVGRVSVHTPSVGMLVSSCVSPT